MFRKTIFFQRKTIGAKGVGLDDVCASGNVGLVDFVDGLGSGD